MKITIELSGNDDAMRRQPAQTIKAALDDVKWRDLFDAHRWAGQEIAHRVKDINGNTIGTVTVREDD